MEGEPPRKKGSARRLLISVTRGMHSDEFLRKRKMCEPDAGARAACTYKLIRMVRSSGATYLPGIANVTRSTSMLLVKYWGRGLLSRRLLRSRQISREQSLSRSTVLSAFLLPLSPRLLFPGNCDFIAQLMESPSVRRGIHPTVRCNSR